MAEVAMNHIHYFAITHILVLVLVLTVINTYFYSYTLELTLFTCHSLLP